MEEIELQNVDREIRILPRLKQMKTLVAGTKNSN
jgi:hypothetical protein